MGYVLREVTTKELDMEERQRRVMLAAHGVGLPLQVTRTMTEVSGGILRIRNFYLGSAL